MPRKSRFAPDIFTEWCHRYNEGESTRQIGRAFGVNERTVYDRLEKMGVTFRSPSASKQRHTYREDAFDTIRDEPTAYWLGFLFADGCLASGRYVQLTLAEKDEPHVEQFRQFMDCSNPLHRDQRRHSVGVSILSEHLHTALNALGCTPRKSLTLAFPHVVPDLARHFIRGYFDGDGSAYVGGGSPTISFAGVPGFLSEIKDRIDAATGTQGKVYPHSKSAISYLIYRGQFAAPYIREWLYQDATVWLSRKRSRMDAFVPGKRQGYPSAIRYRNFASTAGTVSAATIARYIAAQTGL